MLQVEGWVRALAAVLLLAGVAELLLPAGGMKGYARAFLGLLVLLAVLQPAVSLVRGDVRLDLPAMDAPHGGAPGTPAPAAADEAGAARAYEGLIASQAARIAQQVPGVASASATLRFSAAAGEAPGVIGAAVSILPDAAGLAEAGGLPAQVQQAVASGLGLAAGAVAVSVA